MSESEADGGAARRSGWGLALGGGGARALMHWGVLLELERAGLRPSFVTGSSFGALVAALYAAEPPDAPDPAARAARRAGEYFGAHPDFGAARRPARPTGLRRRAGRFGRLAKKMATLAVAGAASFRVGLRRRHPLFSAIDDLFGDRSIESLRLPFGCVALNLADAEEAAFTAGPLAPALKAGASVGFVFKPFVHGGKPYVDAAPTAPVPVSLCRALGADRVLAVDVATPVGRDVPLDTGLDVVMRLIAASTRKHNDLELAKADAVVRPDAGAAFWGDFTRMEELIERGAAAMRARLDAWRARLDGEARR